MVDRLGNINDAIKSAAKKAGIKNYELETYPEQKGLFSKLGNNLSEQMRTRAVKSELGENYIYYQQLKGLSTMMRTPQMRLPYDVVVH